MADDFLGSMMNEGAEEAAPEVVEAQDPQQAVEAPAETPAEPEPVAENVEPKPETPEQRQVPFGAMLDERDRRKAAEQERDELRRWKQEQEAARQSAKVPDAFDDPQGFADYQRQQMEQVQVGLRFEMSDRFARQQHGAEAVQSATDWATQRAQEDQGFAIQMMQQADPVGWIVQQHKRDAMLSDIGDNPDDWFEREAAKRGWQKQSATEPAAQVVAMQQPASKPPAPPRSIAADASAPRQQAPSDEREGFLAAFK